MSLPKNCNLSARKFIFFDETEPIKDDLIGMDAAFTSRAPMFRPENVAGIYEVWKQIADLEAKRQHIAPYQPAMGRAIERKIRRRARILAVLITRDKAGD